MGYGHGVAATVGWVSAVFLAGCSGVMTPTDLTGEWGGAHIRMVVSDQGGEIEYDCATGTIDAGIRPHGDGRFEASGAHVPGHGGPDREGTEADRHPARYEGWTDGDDMVLSVTLVDTGDSVGAFELSKGVSGRLFKCL